MTRPTARLRPGPARNRHPVERRQERDPHNAAVAVSRGGRRCRRPAAVPGGAADAATARPDLPAHHRHLGHPEHLHRALHVERHADGPLDAGTAAAATSAAAGRPLKWQQGR